MSCVNLCADTAGSLREEMSCEVDQSWPFRCLSDIYFGCCALPSYVSNMNVPLRRSSGSPHSLGVVLFTCSEVHCQPAEGAAVPLHS